MKKTAILLILIASLTSCRTIREVPVRTEAKVIERLVPVQLPADSAWLTALFECDSSYNVLLTSLKEEKSRQVETKVEYVQGELRYKVLRLCDTVYLPAKDSIVYQDKVVTVEVEKRYIPQWMVWLAAAGALLLALRLYPLIRK